MQHIIIQDLPSLLAKVDDIRKVAAYKYPVEEVYFSQPYLEASWELAKVKNRKPFFILSYEEESLVAVAPLQIFKMGPRRARCSQLEFYNSQSNPMNYPHSRFLLHEELPVERYFSEIKALLLSNKTPHADQILFTGVYEEDVPFLQQHLPLTEVGDTAPGYSCDLTKGFDHYYMKEVSSRTRQDTRKYARKLMESHNYTINSYPSPSMELIDKVEKIHIERQVFLRSRGRSERQSIFEATSTRNAFKKFLVGLNSEYSLRIDTLEIKDEPIAFLISTLHNGYGNAMIMAFNSEYESFSPLKILAMELLQKANEEGHLVWLGLGHDTNTFKKQFGRKVYSRKKIRGLLSTSAVSKFKYWLCKTSDKL